MEERVAIIGAGPAGAYLYRLLRLRKPHFNVQLFDLGNSTQCREKPCGWATSHPELFSQLCQEAGIEVPFLASYDHTVVVIRNRETKFGSNIAVLDKPAFLESLTSKEVKGERPPLEEFDRIVDATGYSRAYLKLSPAYTVFTVQKRCHVEFDAPFYYFLGRGWIWLIPLGKEAHVGAGSARGFEDAEDMLKKIGLESLAAVCGCSAPIHCGGFRKPFVSGKTWGLGEAIGLVDPVTGEGIVPAMLSAKLMLENWGDPEGYERAIEKTFWMVPKEAKTAKRLYQGKPFLPFVKTFSNVRPTFFQLLKLLPTYLREELLISKGSSS